jgi:hypothetical protein
VAGAEGELTGRESELSFGLDAFDWSKPEATMTGLGSSQMTVIVCVFFLGLVVATAYDDKGLSMSANCSEVEVSY